MPLTRTEHTQRVRKLRVRFPEYEDDPSKYLDVWYKPDVFAEIQEEIAALQDKADLEREQIEDAVDDPIERRRRLRALDHDSAVALYDTMGDVIVDWDMFEDAAQTQKTPISGETFVKMFATVNRITTAIGQADQPDSARSASNRSARRSSRN